MRVGRGESQAEIIGQRDLNSAKIIHILTGRSIRSVRKGVLNIFKYSDFKIMLLDFHSLLCLGSIIKCTSLIFTPPWMIKTWKPSLSYFRQESIRLGFFGIQSCLSGGERFSMEVSLPYWGEEWEEKSSSRSNMKKLFCPSNQQCLFVKAHPEAWWPLTPTYGSEGYDPLSIPVIHNFILSCFYLAFGTWEVLC